MPFPKPQSAPRSRARRILSVLGQALVLAVILAALALLIWLTAAVA